jgi:fatty-acyl-CoA synthase
MPADFRDLVRSVLDHARRDGDRLCTSIVSRRAKEESQSYGELAEAAGRAAAWYAAAGLQRGDVVVFIGTHHLDLPAAWLGCLWCGGIPTIMAEPGVRVDREIYWTRMAELLRRIDAWGLALAPQVRREELPADVRRTATYPEIVLGGGPIPQPFAPSPSDLMLLQHSSGTTGLQKGVMLSHGAVHRHAESYQAALRLTERDVIASWLPLYHDMGFIACFVNALSAGVSTAWLSPFEWVANPGLLLEAVTRHRATHCWLPNFAFAFLAARVKPEPGRYDLSTLRAVVNCSEPVGAEAMQQFAERFAADGLKPAALQSCYAMAENVFAVTTSDDASPPRRRTIDRRRWLETHCAVDVAQSDASNPDVTTLLSSGRCVADCEVRIVDDAGRTQAVDVAGNIRIRSPFLFNGYYRRDDLNAGLFDADGFYSTGDTGFLDGAGHLYVTGRTKDIVIVGGKNVYPQDVENVASVPGVKSGRIVCFGVRLRDLATEGLVVLCESDEPEEAWGEIVRQARTAVPARLDVDLVDARVVPLGTLLKSTSGKLARDSNRRGYAAGKFGPVTLNLEVGDGA